MAHKVYRITVMRSRVLIVIATSIHVKDLLRFNVNLYLSQLTLTHWWQASSFEIQALGQEAKCLCKCCTTVV
jgi:hypothetical protein